MNSDVTAVELGFTLQCDFDGPRTAAIARAAEAAGFAYGWLFDSPLLWRDPYPLLTLMATATKRLRLGTCVTNPSTRHPTTTAATLATLQELSGGRIDLGIGRGDSAVRLLDERPATLDETGEAIRVIRDLVAGRSVTYGSYVSRLVYAPGAPLPVWLAGYGPKALELAARVADGVILQLGDPALVGWMVGRVHDALRRAGRDDAAFRIQVAAPAVLGDRAATRDGVRWFPALVANHVIDLLRREDPATLPPDLTGYVEARGDYAYVPQHDGDYAFVDDATVDRFCILGGIEEHRARIDDLRRAGATQVNLYLMVDEPEPVLRAYGEAGIARPT